MDTEDDESAETVASGPVVREGTFATDDPEAVHRFLSDTYATRGLRIQRPPAGFGYRHRSASTGEFAVQQVHNGASLRCQITAMEDLLVVSTVRAGRLAIERSRFGDRDAGPGDVVLVPPDGRFHTTMDEVDLDRVVLTRRGLADYAAAVTGVDPDRFRITGIAPAAPVAAEHWDLTAAHVRDTLLTSPAAASSPMVLASAARLLYAAFLSTFPNTTLTTDGGPAGRSTRARVPAPRLRVVLDYLHTHADRPLGPADWSGVAGGTPGREIDAALRRHRETTAARELWRARLRGAHRELLAADTTDVSAIGSVVAAVAHRWGFLHPATFRRVYTTFTGGETPERTLRRTR